MLFVIELTYTAPLTAIDAEMKAHMRFLKKVLRLRTLPGLGPQGPAGRRIILAAGESRDEIEAIAREDPFTARRLATARVIEFRPSQQAADIPERIARHSS